MADRNDRIDCLESLRGLAAVLVAVHHFDVGSFLHNGLHDASCPFHPFVRAR